MKPYVITIEAQKDLDDIVFFLAGNDPNAAVPFVDAVLEICEKLANFSQMGRRRDEIALELRSFPVKNYLIFYRVTESNVEIIRVISGYRDLSTLFLNESE